MAKIYKNKKYSSYNTKNDSLGKVATFFHFPETFLF